MKSLSVRPLILCVQVVISTFPQARKMSGWCPCSSASSPTWLTNLSASRKSGNLKVFVRWCSSMTFQPSTCLSTVASSSPLSGGTPPRQGTHVLAARSDILGMILPSAGGGQVWSSDRKMSPGRERLVNKATRRVYSWILRISHANGTYDSLGSPGHTRSAGDGRGGVPGHRNVAGPPAFPAPGAPCASQRAANAHPRNRRGLTDRGLRVRHGRVLRELDVGAAAGGAVCSRGELRPRRTRLERSGARAALGSADRAGPTRAAGCGGRARAVRFGGSLVRRICEPGVRRPVSRQGCRHGAGGFASPCRVEESHRGSVADDRSRPAIRLDCRLAGTIGVCPVLPRAAGAGFTQDGRGGGECVRRRGGRSGATDCGRDSQVANTDSAGCARVVVAAEEFLEPGTARCCTPGQCRTSSYDELARGLPLVVLSGDHHAAPYTAWQRELAQLSSRGRHLVASDCGHWVHLDHPEVVTSAIREVVTAARSAARMEASSQTLRQ